MVIVDKERCTGCGSCAEICHEHCMSFLDGRVVIDRATCSTCTQCIAICRCIIIDDSLLIEEFDRAALAFSNRIYAVLFRGWLFRALVARASVPVREELIRARPKLEAGSARGRAAETSSAIREFSTRAGRSGNDLA